jgi:signal transduction histidine kinase
VKEPEMNTERMEKQELIGEVKKFKDYARNLEQELKITQEKLIQSEKMAATAKVIGYIAHELRKPLANIKTFSQFCLTSKNISLDEKVKERIEIILRNVEKADKIIDGTLSFSRQIKISLKSGSINETLDKICQTCESETGSQVRIVKKFSPELPSIKFDHGHIERAFTNIVQNSLQAMRQGGNLTLETILNQKEKKIIVNFIDTGCGISAEEINQIFAPFFTRREGGIGLGLSLAKEIIELHGGHVSAQSKAGEGTTITAELPVEQ